MADKNLHDIKIDELDSSKKTPLKNILTLLALLFIILVISVVITKLILNTDDGKDINDSVNTSEISTEIDGDNNKSNLISNGAMATTAALATTAAAVPTIKNVLERNLTSRIKSPLRTHEPVKSVKEVKNVKEVKKAPKTYKSPKHAQTSSTKSAKHTSTHSSTPKKEYIDKVVIKKASHTTSTKHSKSKSFLGGREKKLSHSYYIKVGTYKTASTIISKIKKINYNYAVQKTDNGILTRVFVGPFFSQNEAEANLAKIKRSVLKDAFIQKVRP